MPVDDRVKCLTKLQTTDRVVAQQRIRSAAKSEATNHDVRLAPVVILLMLISKAKRGKGNVRYGEKNRHQVLIVKHNLKHIRFKPEIMAKMQ